MRIPPGRADSWVFSPVAITENHSHLSVSCSVSGLSLSRPAGRPLLREHAARHTPVLPYHRWRRSDTAAGTLCNTRDILASQLVETIGIRDAVSEAALLGRLFLATFFAGAFLAAFVRREAFRGAFFGTVLPDRFVIFFLGARTWPGQRGRSLFEKLKTVQDHILTKTTPRKRAEIVHFHRCGSATGRCNIIWKTNLETHQPP